MSLVCTQTPKTLRVDVARTLGTYFVLVGAVSLGSYLGMQAYQSYSHTLPLWWSINREAAIGAFLCLCIAFFSFVGESEACIIDKTGGTITLERRLPFRSMRQLMCPPLSELEDVSIEKDDKRARYQRLVLEFESGPAVALTESFLDTSAGIFQRKGAGIPEAKLAIEKFLNLQTQED